MKIEGINRLFACAGDFTVTYEGVLRDPPRSWLRTLALEHLNKNIDTWEFLENAVKGKLIKIPDVYRVELKFKSLLPANFNNFLFSYAQQAGHMSGNKTYEESVITKTISTAIGKFGKRVANVWDGGNGVLPSDKLTGPAPSSNFAPLDEDEEGKK